MLRMFNPRLHFGTTNISSVNETYDKKVKCAHNFYFTKSLLRKKRAIHPLLKRVVDGICQSYSFPKILLLRFYLKNYPRKILPF